MLLVYLLIGYIKAMQSNVFFATIIFILITKKQTYVAIVVQIGTKEILGCSVVGEGGSFPSLFLNKIKDFIYEYFYIRAYDGYSFKFKK